jgi:hypothetical protein
MGTPVTCNGCGKKWPWNERTAGRRFRCTCGAIVEFAAAVSVVPVEEEDPLASVEEDPSIVPLAATPPAAPAPAAKPLEYHSTRTRSPEQTARQNYDLVLGGRMRDFYVPTALILLGSLLYFGRTIYVAQSFQKGCLMASTQMVFNALVTISVVMTVNRLADLDLGSTAGTILKLFSVSVFPNAVAGMALVMAGSCFGIVLGFVLSIGLSLLLFRKLFDASLSAAVLCVTFMSLFQVFSWSYVDKLVEQWLN